MTKSTFLVLGATGGTGKHFVSKALADGHRVRALVRTPRKLTDAENLEVVKGSITDAIDTDALVAGVDFIVSMLGDKTLQKTDKINLAFVERLVPSMRRQGVKRFLYQAGGFSRASGQRLSPVLWVLRNTIARSFEGQHRDNEAVIEYLATQGMDIEWSVHRAGIGGDGPSKGSLERSKAKISIASHKDCAAYNYRTVMDASAIHTCDFSAYTRT